MTLDKFKAVWNIYYFRSLGSKFQTLAVLTYSHFIHNLNITS